MNHSTRPLAFSAVKKLDTEWITKDKKVLQISEMSDKHVYDCVQLLERYKAQVPVLMSDRMPSIIENNPEFLL